MKLPAGDAVIYPTTSLHQVTEVTRGERLVAVSWIQSMVPHEDQREMLYEFGQSVDMLAKERPGAQITLDLTNIYTNLKRRWCIG
jgi:PKHD-type hydroxylase